MNTDPTVDGIPVFVPQEWLRNLDPPEDWQPDDPNATGVLVANRFQPPGVWFTIEAMPAEWQDWDVSIRVENLGQAGYGITGVCVSAQRPASDPPEKLTLTKVHSLPWKWLARLGCAFAAARSGDFQVASVEWSRQWIEARTLEVGVRRASMELVARLYQDAGQRKDVRRWVSEVSGFSETYVAELAGEARKAGLLAPTARTAKEARK